jgi:hypothetical protein
MQNSNIDIQARGLEVMKSSSVSICSIVRDCDRNLLRNISRVESLRNLFRESEVIIFENDSKDNTLGTLKDWQNSSRNIIVFSEKYNEQTIPLKKNGTTNPYFSISRIRKMVAYRNKYMSILNTGSFIRDYVIVIDLDIAEFKIEGVIHSFGVKTSWDCITANGYSLSSRFKHQYHDSYALIEYGKISDTQTESSIEENRRKFSFLKKGMPLLQVDSAYGGMAIYKWSSIKGLQYYFLLNDDPKVECKSEHVGLHNSMKKNGSGQIFINPSMIVKYRNVDWKFIISKVFEKISRYRY